MTTPHIEAAARAILSNDGWKEKAIDKMRDEQHVEWKEAVAIASIVWNLAALPASGPAGWIVSNGNETKWRCWKDGFSAWTDNRDEATRYARREDAEAVHAEDEDAWSIKPYSIVAPAVERDAVLEEAAKVAFDALDVADRIIERACGLDTPAEWNEAYQAVARARAKGGK